MSVCLPCKYPQRDRSYLDLQHWDHSHTPWADRCTGHTQNQQSTRHQDHQLPGHSHTRGGMVADTYSPEIIKFKLHFFDIYRLQASPYKFRPLDKSYQDHLHWDHSHSPEGGTCTGHTESLLDMPLQDHRLPGHSHTQEGTGGHSQLRSGIQGGWLCTPGKKLRKLSK